LRHRPKNWTGDELGSNPRFIYDPGGLRGGWGAAFGNSAPIYLEIGCGKGGFILDMAQARPDVNFIGIEKEELIIAMALRGAKNRDFPPNLLFACANARHLCDIFDKNELGRIYLNFSDPWRSRSRWRKRRLTHGDFLDIYEEIMHSPEVFFKTDDPELFRFSMAEFSQSGWEIKNITHDLHNSEYAAENIQTEYEKRFVSQGKPICRLEAYKNIV